MIDRTAAATLLDFGARIGSGQRADEQLEGAVALHNILEEHGVAYLADEVGMGKTYVALGAAALFRHFDPSFRLLVIAPRENIQSKWMKDFRNFVRYNVRFPDLRVKALDGSPVRPLVACGNLVELVREVSIDNDRDFFARLTSFSLPVSGDDTVDASSARRLRDKLREHLPWVRDEVFDLRKQAFKENVARAVCGALPVFDLVIVDEGHNLKHGFSERVAARNRVMALVFGHPAGAASREFFPHYGSRVKRVLFLSATPVEETYRHLWNQLAIFNRTSGFDVLNADDVDDVQKRRAVSQFLIRRVTSLKTRHSGELTKNLYRREWRQGGVENHDDPIHVTDPRQRLIVALVQKKVSELLGHEHFNRCFQIGMLASFESFLETAKVKRGGEEAPNFDDSEQSPDDLEREGIDVNDVNHMTRAYRTAFREAMPHPKMDAVVTRLAQSWGTGEKALIFVRRVHSVKELKRRLDDFYDEWLLGRLRGELPSESLDLFEKCVRRYVDEREQAVDQGPTGPQVPSSAQTETEDRGGTDTFFAWFFRGEGPRGVVSGANIQQRFMQRGAVYATFFADNYVADLLGCEPDETEAVLATVLGVERDALRAGLRQRARVYLTKAKRHARADRFEAVQAAAIEWLKDHPGALQERATLVWRERFLDSRPLQHAAESPDIDDWLQLRTFFTELRRRPELRARLWPEPESQPANEHFRERELRGQLLAAAARLGHALIDLYVLTIKRVGTLEPRAQDAGEDDGEAVDRGPVDDYLDLLERQMQTPLEDRPWGAFDELAEIGAHFSQIVDLNSPVARQAPLSEAAKEFGRLLRQQQPVGGMVGQVNNTLVRQFRMPGYPCVLVSTDLLQEGEDLHTFCSSVYHYGISWTPSSMEQRIGRVDRVRSLTERRLNSLDRAPNDSELLQVYFPHLQDTVEVLQVRRVLERMNTFLRLMHEGLKTDGPGDRRIDTVREFIRELEPVPAIRERLKSAFPVTEAHTHGNVRTLAVAPDFAEQARQRFEALATSELRRVTVAWEPHPPSGRLLGTARVNDRQQPFTLLLRSFDRRLLVRCISPVGAVSLHEELEALTESALKRPVRIGAVDTDEETTYNLTIEADALLGEDPTHDVERVSWLVARVVSDADMLERAHLPGQDQDMKGFRSELESEATSND